MTDSELRFAGCVANCLSGSIKETGMKTLLKCAVALSLSFALVACNTIEGIGKDVEKAGDTIENAAKDNK